MRIIDKLLLVVLCFCMPLTAMEGHPYLDTRIQPRTDCRCQPVIYATYDNRAVLMDQNITEEQRSLMWMYNLSVPPLILGSQKPAVAPNVPAIVIKEIQHITAEQRSLMQMYRLSVPPVIMGVGKQVMPNVPVIVIKEKPVVSIHPVVVEVIPVKKEIKVTVEPFKPVELQPKRNQVKVEVLETAPVIKREIQVTVEITQEQRDLMISEHLSVPPVILKSKEVKHIPRIPDIVVNIIGIEKHVSFKVIELTDANFDSKISKGVSVVEFGAIWCGPCRRMGPIFEASMNKYSGVLSAFKVDIDVAKSTAAQRGVSSVPYFAVFIDGKYVDSHLGAMSRDGFEEWITPYYKEQLRIQDAQKK